MGQLIAQRLGVGSIDYSEKANAIAIEVQSYRDDDKE
jgi:hypothetical protein